MRRSILSLSLLLALLLVVPLALYLPYAANEFVTYDDGLLVQKNERVQRFDPAIWWTYDPELYVPLTLFTYQIDHVVFGGSATAVHATTALLHATATVILFFLLRRLGFAAVWSCLGALLFAVHPLQVESVAWASGRKEVLFTMFFLLSFLLYVRGNRWGSWFAFLLSVLSKVTAVFLPVLLLVLDWYREQRLHWRMVTDKWAFWLVSVVFGVVALFGKSSDMVLNAWETVLLAGRTTVFFLQKFVVPTGLSVMHPVTESILFSAPAYWIPLVLLAAAVVVLFRWRHRMPRVVLGAAAFLCMLLPSFLGYAKADQIHLASEHYMYAPLVGLVIMIMSGVVYLQRWLPRYVLVGAVVLWLVALSTVSWQQLTHWRNSETLYTHALRLYPDSYVAANNLAVVYLDDNRVDAAIHYLRQAIEQNPAYAEGYVNLSEALRRKGKYSAAQKASMRALELNPDMETVYAKTQPADVTDDVDAAIARVRMQLEQEPDNADLWWQLGRLYGQKEEYLQGLRAFQRAAELDPSRREQAEMLREALEKVRGE